jgi:hypothetical protein
MNSEQALDIIACELSENDRKEFTFAEAQGFCVEHGIGNESRPSLVIQGLKARGFVMVERLPPRRFRTLSSNSHDRWEVSKCHGGGGGSSIFSMAGAEA